MNAKSAKVCELASVSHRSYCLLACVELLSVWITHAPPAGVSGRLVSCFLSVLTDSQTRCSTTGTFIFHLNVKFLAKKMCLLSSPQRYAPQGETIISFRFTEERNRENTPSVGRTHSLLSTFLLLLLL